MPDEFSHDEIKKGDPKAPIPTQSPQNAGMMMTTELSNIGRRVRSLEEHYSNIIKKNEVIDNNMLMNNKRVMLELKTMNVEVSEMKRDMEEIKERFMLLVKELQLCAKKEEVKILERYINMWEPLNFVTRAQVERVVKEILQQQGKDE